MDQAGTSRQWISKVARLLTKAGIGASAECRAPCAAGDSQPSYENYAKSQGLLRIGARRCGGHGCFQILPDRQAATVQRSRRLPRAIRCRVSVGTYVRARCGTGGPSSATLTRSALRDEWRNIWCHRLPEPATILGSLASTLPVRDDVTRETAFRAGCEQIAAGRDDRERRMMFTNADGSPQFTRGAALACEFEARAQDLRMPSAARPVYSCKACASSRKRIEQAARMVRAADEIVELSRADERSARRVRRTTTDVARASARLGRPGIEPEPCAGSRSLGRSGKELSLTGALCSRAADQAGGERLRRELNIRTGHGEFVALGPKGARRSERLRVLAGACIG